MQIPSLTPGRFLFSPELRDLCKKYQAKSLTDIHRSFANEGRLGLIIQKHRLIHYPAGQSLNGVVFAKANSPTLSTYIQDVVKGQEGHLFIVCLTKNQADHFHQIQSFEVDMSSKRLHDKDLHELVFARRVPEQSKVTTLCRVFTNQDKRVAYKAMFQRVFERIEQLTGRPCQFGPIHNCGIWAVVVDMDWKQRDGFADYLSLIPPATLDSGTIALQMTVFCHIHFRRGIDELLQRQLQCGTTEDELQGVRTALYRIKDAKTLQLFYDIIDTFLHEDCYGCFTEIANWLRHKKQVAVAYGLCHNLAYCPPSIKGSLVLNTNAVEQTHNKANLTGKSLQLLPAIEKNMEFVISIVKVVCYHLPKNGFRDINPGSQYGKEIQLPRTGMETLMFQQQVSLKRKNPVRVSRDQQLNFLKIRSKKKNFGQNT
ncbi:uncharacterized protein N7483_006298 [Penicillium malachiteum]|uniref:uncharacterized protein n=1 Tax=Penicillium malachiteum TaxID=1324776 RepID=UPI002549B78F|nr:uncharacterized protein N7483_006298 [Penicillium malachiteum]KAJ5731790.1 hypothetical protein N7483_006298 [Penicillium malachiteum]